MRKIKTISVVCNTSGKNYTIGDRVNNCEIFEFIDCTNGTPEGVINYLIAKDFKGETVVEFLNVPVLIEYYDQ